MKVVFIVIAFISTIQVFSQNSNLVDRRALNKYSVDEINKMPKSKIDKLNYFYSSSFIVPEEMKGLINAQDIDIADYSLFRKEKTNEKIDLGAIKEHFTGKYIILISHEELEKAYNEIENKYCTPKK